MTFEEKKQARVDRLRAAAARAKLSSHQHYTMSRDMMAVIPLGQPVLIDHYSAKGDMRYRARAAGHMDQAVADQNKADYYEAKAQAAESNTAISSDDPDALDKLQKKLADLMANQEQMKAMNAHYRKKGTMAGFPGMTDQAADKLDAEINAGYTWDRRPAPAWMLSNNNANIKRVEQRIASLKKVQGATYQDWDFSGGQAVINRELNRLQLMFDAKPSEELRDQLFHNGFHWSPREKAWQRQLNPRAVSVASYLLKKAGLMQE